MREDRDEKSGDIIMQMSVTVPHIPILNVVAATIEKYIRRRRRKGEELENIMFRLRISSRESNSDSHTNISKLTPKP